MWIMRRGSGIVRIMLLRWLIGFMGSVLLMIEGDRDYRKGRRRAVDEYFGALL